jgi:excisionase family DNA binding protein
MVLSLDASPNRAERRRAASNRQYEIKPLRYTVQETAAALRCSRLHVYDLIKRGLLRAQGTKRKIWITAASLEGYVENEPDYQP